MRTIIALALGPGLPLSALAQRSTPLERTLPAVAPEESERQAAQVAAPGRLIDIGGRRMHLHCRGQGRPTVVVDQGAGLWSVHWMHLHRDLASIARTCLFDRAGLGWSDPSPEQSTSLRATEDLARLLSASGESGPFVLVGHSYGGYNARVFRSKYPDQVLGVVLVESGHEDQWTRLPAPLTDVTKGAVAPLRELAAALRAGALVPEQPVDSGYRDPRQVQLLRAAARTPAPYEELAGVIEGLDSSTARVRRSGGLGRLPLVVLSARRSYDAFRHLPISVDSTNAVWAVLQTELAGLSSCAVHRWSERGDHNLHVSDPAAILAGIKLMVQALNEVRGATCPFPPEGRVIRRLPLGRLPLQICQVPAVDETVLCGSYRVWENRTTQTGRLLSLRVVVIPALDPDPEPDPILVLEGGPGQSNVGAAGFAAGTPLRRRRNLLLIDVRGTGQSAPLDCGFQDAVRAPRTEFLPLEGVRECLKELSARADLSRYTSNDVVDDLSDVLKALGIPRVNLWGFSGGTRQALVFLRRHPAQVRSALLEGPVPLDARVPLTFAADAQAALDGVFEECLGEGACGGRFGSIAGDFQTVLSRLSAGPITIPVGASDSTPASSMTVTRSGFAQVVRYMLYQPAATRSLPLAVHLAARNDFSLFEPRLRTLGIPGGVSYGFYLASTCAEDLQWFSVEEGLARSAGTFLGDYRVRQQKEACEGWPTAGVQRPHLEPVRSEHPVLVLVGERDPVTPPRWGAEILRDLPRGRLMIVPDGGHGFAGLEGGDCLARLRDRFLSDGNADALDLACLGGVKRPPFLLRTSP